jgi:hypothetical protein
MRQKLTTALEVAGGVLVAAGVAMVYVPAGVIAAGVVSVCLGYLAAR